MGMLSSHRIPGILAIVTVLALLLGACAPAAPSPTPAPAKPVASAPTTAPAQPVAPAATAAPAKPAESAAAAKPSGNPVVIGLAISLSGSQAQPGEDQFRGIQLWLGDVNSRGGILGRPVELKYYDDQSAPQTSAKLLEKLITEDKVDLLIGPYHSSALSAASTVNEKYKRPLIGPGASAGNIFERGYQYVFQTYSPARGQARPLVELAKSAGYQTIAHFHEDTANGEDFAVGLAASAKEFGLQLVMREKYTTPSTDFSSLIQRAKALKPDVLFPNATFQDATVIARQAREANLVPKMFTYAAGGPATAEFAQVLGTTAEGMMGFSQWEPSASYPGNKEFVQRFQARYNREPSYTAAGGYGAGQVLEVAVKMAGSLDPDAVRNALVKTETMTIFGAYKVDATGLQVGHAANVIQIQGGKKKVTWPKEAAEAEPKLPFQGWQ